MAPPSARRSMPPRADGDTARVHGIAGVGQTAEATQAAAIAGFRNRNPVFFAAIFASSERIGEIQHLDPEPVLEFALRFEQLPPALLRPARCQPHVRARMRADPKACADEPLR